MTSQASAPQRSPQHHLLKMAKLECDQNSNTNYPVEENMKNRYEPYHKYKVITIKTMKNMQEMKKKWKEYL